MKTKKYLQNKELPRAILVDMDGTLALMKGRRSPFDWNKVDQDDTNPPIVEMVQKYHKDGYKIIILTGRDGSALGLTNSWLTKHNVPFSEIFIRPEGNNEKDAIIKERIFRNHIEKKYNVEFVLDDRTQVVEMWRDIGLVCLQVDNGDF